MQMGGLANIIRSLTSVGRVSELMRGICNPDEYQQTIDPA